MAKKISKIIGCSVEEHEVHSIKILAAYLNSVPYIIVRKAIKRFLHEYENAENLPEEFLSYCKLKKLEYATIRARIAALSKTGGK